MANISEMFKQMSTHGEMTKELMKDIAKVRYKDIYKYAKENRIVVPGVV